MVTNNAYLETVQKLHEVFRKSGWFDPLKTFLLSDDFYKIVEQLYINVEDGLRFTPTLKQVFRAFELCPYDKLKVVIVGEYPYKELGKADGLAFSGKSTSNRNILKAVSKTVYGNSPPKSSTIPDLSRWAQQGVLLLNTSLTTGIAKHNNHARIWQPFISFLMDIILMYKPDAVWIFMNDQVRDTEGWLMDENTSVLSGDDVSDTFDCNDLFNKTNKILSEKNILPVVW